jgi:diguanylate cyclase (GGDEF)-like protein/PAS domain S-box-containing protein
MPFNSNPEKQLEDAAYDFFHSSHEAIYTADLDGLILACNARLTLLTGYSTEELIGSHTRMLKSGIYDSEFYRIMWDSIKEYGFWHGQITNRRKDGSFYTVITTITSVYDADGTPIRYLSVGSDITQIIENKNQLEYSAYYDSLTGIPNRLLLLDRIKQSISYSNRNKTFVAILYIDLDGFKDINDNLGHDVGDEFLKEISQRMKSILRESDTIARLGGDEFVIVLNNLTDKKDCEVPAKKILQICSSPIEIDGILLQTSASIGISFHPAEPYAVEADALIRQADQSMYIAKMQGKNQCHIYDKMEDDPITTRQEMIDQIHPSLQRGDFFLCYQPKINMITGDLIGVEALLRWKHPTRGILAPMEFLNIIQKTPIGVQVSCWVIKEALRQSSVWKEDGLYIPISVNLDPVVLSQCDFVDKLNTIIHQRPNFNPGDISFEILESSIIEDNKRVSEIIDQCKEMGITFGLDDFGTGYSSLSHIRNLSIDHIKIDKSFVMNLIHNPIDRVIVESIINLSNALNLTVIAEGVETAEQGRELIKMGCTYAQGYYISKPILPEKIPFWLREWKLSSYF